MDEPKFSLDDFKHWMRSQKEYVSKMPKRNAVIGTMVESKISSSKLASKICPNEGNFLELLEDFKKIGGKIIDVDGKSFLIEVDSGTFYIPRQYVKRV